MPHERGRLGTIAADQSSPLQPFDGKGEIGPCEGGGDDGDGRLHTFFATRGPYGPEPAPPDGGFAALLDRAVALAARGDLALLRSELLATLGLAREPAIREAIRRAAVATDRAVIRTALAPLFDNGGTR